MGCAKAASPHPPFFVAHPVSTIEVRCPQCGVDTAARVRVAFTCGHCQSLLVHFGSEVRKALTYNGQRHSAGDADVRSEGGTVAFICRCCAGALSPEVLAAGTDARCHYCGESASIAPGVLALLRVASTRPYVFPDLTRTFRYWMFIALIFGVLAVGASFLPSPAIAHNEVLPLHADTLPVRSQTVHFRRHGNTFPYLLLNFWASRDGSFQSALQNSEIRLLVYVVQEKTGARRGQWLTFYHGKGDSDDPNTPNERAYGEFRFQDSTAKIHPVAIGPYHLEIARAVVTRGSLPDKVALEWRTHQTSGAMAWIFIANLLLWLFAWDFRRESHTPTDQPHARWSLQKTLGIGFLLLLCVHMVIPLGSIGKEGVFVSAEGYSG